MKNHHAFARLIALLLLCALLLCGCELPTSDTDAAQATATPAVTSTEDISDTEVTAASEPAAGLTLEWLTSDLFYTNFQCPTAVEFHADGTFTEFYIEPATMQLLDEVACTGTFELSDEKVIMLFDGKHARTLTYLSPSWQPDCQYESRYQEAMQLLDKDEFFLYEIDYVQEYDERGQPEDDAAMFYVPGYLQKISASPETDELILKIEGTWALADWAEYHFHADGRYEIYSLDAFEGKYYFRESGTISVISTDSAYLNADTGEQHFIVLLADGNSIAIDNEEFNLFRRN